jgi:hypothetical protein
VGGGSRLRVRLRRSSDLDRNSEGTGVDYDLVLSVGHDEYWSARQRRAVEATCSAGQLRRLLREHVFWQVRLVQTDMVCHKYTAHETDLWVPGAATRR